MSLLQNVRAKLVEFKAEIDELTKKLGVQDAELQRLREEQAANPPGSTFSQSWAQTDRMLTRRLVGAERERSDLAMTKAQMEKNYELQLRKLEEESALQLRADKSWWEKRLQEHLQRTKTSREREARLQTNQVCDDLRLLITSEDDASRVRKAIEDVQHPEILEALSVANPNFGAGVDFYIRTARERLRIWELGSKPDEVSEPEEAPKPKKAKSAEV